MNKKNIEAIYPLSPSQQGMLFETLAFPNSGIYIEQVLWKLLGKLDDSAFEHAWQRVLERHPVLRTCFVWQDQKEPLQIVLRQVNLPFEQQDWQADSPAQQQERLDNYLHHTRSTGFTLSQAPLLRAGLFRLQAETAQFVLTFHHILMDGWCLPLLIKDMLQAYLAFRQGQEPSFAPAPPYVEYVRWLKRQDLNQAETFWRKTLRGFTRPTPSGKIDPSAIALFSEKNAGYGEQTVTLSAQLTTRLRTVVTQQRLTFNTVFQGLWALLLSRYSGQHDVVFGATVSGRPANLPGAETMLGLFINTLPVRLMIAPDARFIEWIQAFQTRQNEQRLYEYCSAGQIQQWSDMPAKTPLYESILVFENYPAELDELLPAELQLECADFRVVGAQTIYPLTILIVPGAELSIKLVYNQQRFTPAGITQILAHVHLLCEAILGDQNQTLNRLTALIPDEEIPLIAPMPSTSSTSAETPFVLPRTPTEQRLAALWQTVLGVSQVSVTANFFESGGHSLVALRLMAEIQRQFGKSFPVTTFFRTPTIAELARLLDEQTAQAAFTPLVPIQPQGNKLPFFCVHAVDGGVFYYNDLAQHLGVEQPFYGIQASGLEPGTPVLTTVPEMAAKYVAALRSAFPHGPYVIGGYSSGGLHAYEMARQLRQAGAEVALLALIDMTPYYTVFDAANHFLALMREIGGYLQTDLVQLYCQARGLDPSKGEEAVRPDLQLLSSRQRLELLGACIQETGAFPPGVSAERMERIIQVFTATSEAVQQYQVQPYDGRIALFRSIHDLRQRIAEPDYGWGQYVSTPLELYDVPGTHFTLIRKPNVPVLAEQLRRCLAAL